MKRETILEESSDLIHAYFEAYKSLPSGSQKDVLYTSTFVEGLVFRCISDIYNKYGIKTNNKLSRCDYITEAARKQIEQKDMKGLIREHMVPKTVYFSILVDESRKGILTKERIFDLLNRYYWTCIVTKTEDYSLGKSYKSKMPEDWDYNNIFARYEKVSISTVIEYNGVM